MTKLFTLFVLALCMVAAQAAIAEAGCGRIFGGRLLGGIRARHQARVEHRRDRRDERIQRRDNRRSEAPEQIPAPTVERDDTRFASSDE